MKNGSDEDTPNVHPTVQVIGPRQLEGDASDSESENQIPDSDIRPGRGRFWVAIDTERLAATPRELSYFEWSIITDPMEINEEDSEAADGDLENDSDAEPESMDNGDEVNVLDGIDNIEESGGNLDDNWQENDLSSQSPGPPAVLEGYEYTKFDHTPINYNSPAIAGPSSHMCPTQLDVLAAMEDLEKILHPSRNTG
jgi:hypothetical protein